MRVADTMRTSSGIGSVPPTRTITFDSIARSNFTCNDAGISRDLVEQQRAARASKTFALRDCARETAFLVPEQLRFRDIGRNRAAVHGERAVAPGTEIVQPARDDILADPLSPAIITLARVGGDLLDAAEQRAHRGGPAGQPAAVRVA